MRFAPNPLPTLALLAEPACVDNSWPCTAGHLLHWLYAIAIVLAVILLLVSALAIRLWRKNKNPDGSR